eukprot:scaffold62365_cov28-Prasinocladus_malaysianus.AAC.1
MPVHPASLRTSRTTGREPQAALSVLVSWGAMARSAESVIPVQFVKSRWRLRPVAGGLGPSCSLADGACEALLERIECTHAIRPQRSKQMKARHIP